MGKLLTVEDQAIMAVWTKIQAARKDADTVALRRKKGTDAYFKRKLGNEREGRAQYLASNASNHVDSVHPHLMRRYLSTDHKISIKGPEAETAQALKQMARSDITDQGGFRLINDLLKDGEVSNNGTCKVYWRRIWKDAEEQLLPDASEEDLIRMGEDVRFSFSEQDVVANPIRMADVEDGVGGFLQVQGKQTYRVRVKFSEIKESGPVVSCLPPEEFIVERGKVRMNDRKGCGHRRDDVTAGELIRENESLSLPGEPYYRNLRTALASAATSATGSEKEARELRESIYWDPSPQPADTPLPSFDGINLAKRCEVVEWADYATVNGALVPALFFWVNGVIVRVEENEDGIIPYCTWSPRPDPHSLFGGGIAEVHADEQNVTTVLARSMLDSIAFSIDRTGVAVSSAADLLGAQDRRPGEVRSGQPGDIVWDDTPVLDVRVFNVLEWLKGEGEEVGPGTRFNMGTDGDPNNQTATGISLVQRASFNKIDMIALAFGELLLVDLYNKLIWLYQHQLDRERTVFVKGKPVKITKDKIQGDYRAVSDLGIEVDFDDRAFGKAQALNANMMAMLKVAPMLFPLKQIYAHQEQLYLAAGVKDVGELIAPPPQELENWFPGQPLPGQEPPPGMLAPPASAGVPPPTDGLMVPQPAGRDYVSGQDTSQPDETLMEV